MGNGYSREETHSVGKLKSVSTAMPLEDNVLFVQEAMSRKRKRCLTVFDVRARHDLLYTLLSIAVK